MSTQVQEKPLLELDSPALAKPDWLPETDWDDLEEMRETHRRLLATRAEISKESLALYNKYEAEDKARSEAMQANMRGGTKKQLPKVTPPEEREKKLAEISEKGQAIRRAFDSFLREAEKQLEERAPDWLADMNASDAAAMARYEEAKAAMRAAQTEVASRKKLRMWIEREAGMHPTFKTTPMRHFPYGEMGDPPLEPEAITPETLRGGVQIG